MSKTNNNRAEMVIYVKYMAAIMLFMLTVATAQHYITNGSLQLKYYFAPLFIGALIGFLFARAEILKNKLAFKSELFNAIANLAVEFTYFRRVDGVYEYVSPSCLEVTGYTEDHFYSHPHFMDELIYKEDREKWRTHIHSINDSDKHESFDIRILSQGGDIKWISHLCSPVLDKKGVQIGVRSTNLDITVRKTYEEKYKQMALYDSLTQLPNRFALMQHLEELTQDKEKNEFALLYLDLVRFNHINNRFGHAFGDRILIEIADRLRSIEYGYYISRIGGDEFIIIANDVSDSEPAIDIANEIVQLIEKPLNMDDMELYLTVSVGISCFPKDGTDPEILIGSADVAKYQAKDLRDSTGVYTEHLSEKASHFLSTENEIHKAIKNNEFTVHYQPKVNMFTHQIVGVEALVRWEHPDKGMLNPGSFINIAEETGQIIEMGRLVLEQCMRDIAAWKERGTILPVAINMSARQLTNFTHCQNILATIRDSNINHKMLELEVTEQVFLGDIEHTIQRLNVFRDLGISIALDDFGTGYSSLQYLKLLPIDTLKIDRSFVADLQLGEKPLSILKAILTMAKDLNLKVVVEGVETEAQLEQLKSMDCEVAQGFYFHRPMPLSDLNILLDSQFSQQSTSELLQGISHPA